MELNDVIKELEELKARVLELENRISKTTVPDIPDSFKYIATDEDGSIFMFYDRPVKGERVWFPQTNKWFDRITGEQAIIICGRIPEWSDEEPTPVKL